MASEYDFPFGSLDFLNRIRESVDSNNALVFADFLEENGKIVLAKKFRKLAEWMGHRTIERYNSLTHVRRQDIPTLVKEGEQKYGYRILTSWYRGNQLRCTYYQCYFTARRTKGGWLRWRDDSGRYMGEDTDRRGAIPSELILFNRPCSFADRIIRNPVLDISKR